MKIFRRKSNNKGNYTERNRVRIIRGGKEYFELLINLIGEARHVIHLQYYIFLEDQTGTMVTEALKKAAERGVLVYMHIDAYASKKFSKDFMNGIFASGIKFKRFEPLLTSRRFYFGRRMHHKVFVADGVHSLVGGINISDNYNDTGVPAWLDMAVYTEGETSIMLHSICRKMWGSKIPNDNISLETKEDFLHSLPKEEYRAIAVSRNDWVMRKNEIWRNYARMFNHSQKEVTIMCSYFLPGQAFRKQISRAVKRGVKFRLILAGMSDILLAKHAERFLYDWMLRKKIDIYEYQESVLHAKVATFDMEWSTIGSFNVNNISSFASLELNVDIKSKIFAEELENKIEEIISNGCVKISEENYKASTNIFMIFWQRMCYSFINLVLRIFTFYFRQE